MPSTSTKENAGRLKSFKNSGKDKDVSVNIALHVHFETEH